MRLLILLIAAIVIYLFLRWLVQQPRKAQWQFLALLGGVALVALAATGRLHWVAALVGALLPFARRLLGLIGYLPMLQRAAAQYRATQGAAGANAGNTSTVESQFLRMTLDHDSGEMEGEVLHGKLKGKRLSTLSLEELIELFAECQAQDEESAALLQAYLEKVHAQEWQAHVHAEQADDAHANPRPSGKMSPAEAYEILGLEPGASREEIVEAHRRLMQKLHPDRGGSTYLAAKINQAKDVLLG